jgi:hypothetical protein
MALLLGPTHPVSGRNGSGANGAAATAASPQRSLCDSIIALLRCSIGSVHKSTQGLRRCYSRAIKTEGARR